MKKQANIKNVAEIAQVSISTVSRVLNNSVNVSPELQERVYRAIDETKYSVNPIASTLKSAKRNQIAIVFPSLQQTYYTDIIRGISDFCYNKQVTPVILESGGEVDKEIDIISNLEKQWIDGIIFIPSKNINVSGYKDFISSLAFLKKQENKIPVVLVECDGFGNNLDCVRVDYESAFYKMTYHLLEIGRKNIAYLSAPEESSLYNICLNSVKKAVVEYGLELNEDALECSGYNILGGYQAMKRILQRNPTVDGVICINDQVASGALHACRESDIKDSQKIAIVGFGGVAMSIITTPSITTMVVPRYEIGSMAGEILFERIDGSKAPYEKRILQSHMAIRESTLRTGFKKMDMMFME